MGEMQKVLCRLSPRRKATIIALWILAILTGFAILIDHDLRAGPAAAAVRRWPASSSLVRSGSGPTIVMFIHPHCPCTAASLAQLESIASDKAFKSAITYLVVADVAENESGENLDRARHIPGASVQFDAQDSEVRRFGSRTSGELLIFDENGRLTFEGGITAARGHQGDNLAASAALAALRGANPNYVQMPVFGCAL